MYVTFKTNNPDSVPKCPTPIPAGCLGSRYSSVMGVLDDPGPSPTNLQFTGLYTLSGPAPSTLSGPSSAPPTPKAVSVALHSPGLFVNNSIATGTDGYIYIWGSAGGLQDKTNPAKPSCEYGLEQCSRHSPVYLARIPVGMIARASGDGRPADIQYFDKTSFAPVGSLESVATPLFTDSPPCVGELGVEYDPYVGSWVMLYNCADNTPEHPPGIWMRTAPQPWGPWSAPQTIDHGGGPYAPYFIAGWTTGTSATAAAAATSTFYYTVSSFKPYGVVIMKTTVKWGYPLPLPPKPAPPSCKGTKCM